MAAVLLLVAMLLVGAPLWSCMLLIGVWLPGGWLAFQWRWQQARHDVTVVADVPQAAAHPVTECLADRAAPVAATSAPAESCAPERMAALDLPASVVAEATPMTDAEQDVLRYALSHDLRAPLRVIDGFTRIVKEDYGRHLDRLGNDHLERVLAASARMNGMIDAILAQAQLANAALERQDIDLTAMAHEVAGELLALRAEAAAARCIVAEGLRVQADALLLRRVLENLLGNALKYSAKVAEPCVELGCMPATNPPVYFVRDNGAGFDMQHADKLFGMFQRLHSVKDFPGTGVGLAGVRNIIRRHGGRVWAEAKPGEGACFYFTLIGSAEAQRTGGG